MRNLIFVTAVALLALPAIAQTVPGTMNYQGRLTDNTPQQNPLTATVNMSFEIWDVASGGTVNPDRLWLEPVSGTVPVAVTGGIFNVQLGGNGVALPAVVFSGGTQRYLQLYVNGEALSPRQAIGATGYANQAQNAANAVSAVSATNAGNALQLGGTAASGYQLATAQSCGAGQFLNVIANGSASCATPPTNNLNPPVSLTGTANPIFSATNAGFGGAGNFSIVNIGSGANALTAFTSGTGSALRSVTSGPGPGAYLYSNGNGNAATIVNDNSGASNPALFVGNTSTAPTIKAENNNGVGDIFQGWNGNIQPVFRVTGAGGVTSAGVISGDIVNVISQFNLNGTRVLSATGAGNLFAGNGAGSGNATGTNNTFAGIGAGSSNTTASLNAYFGSYAGQFSNGGSNAFFGGWAGQNNTSGFNNAFFGAGAGLANTGENDNTYIGNVAGRNSTASNNAFLGGRAGYSNTSGGNNTFIGQWTAISHATGNNNTALGYNADIADGISNATAIGANSIATASNTLVLGTGAMAVQVPGSLSVSGVISGNGSGLTNLPGGNLAPPVTLAAANAGAILSSTNSGAGPGVFGENTSGAPTSSGVYGTAAGRGVEGYSAGGAGVYGMSETSTGVYGRSQSSSGLYGLSVSSYGAVVENYSDVNATLLAYSGGGGPLLQAYTSNGLAFGVDYNGNVTAGGNVSATGNIAATGSISASGNVTATGRITIGVYTNTCTPNASPYDCACNAGDTVIGGGAFTFAPNAMRESRPGSASSWRVDCVNSTGTVVCAQAYAMCLSRGN